MSDAVRFGFVGTGGVVLHGLLPHMVEADIRDKVRVTALCDPLPGRAEAAARKYGVPHAFRTFEEMIDAGVVDAVTIASPIGLHYEQGKMAIDAGLHIHFNKTMATTVDEANEIEELARNKKVKIVPSPGCMLHPARRAMRTLVREGALGAIAWAATGAGAGSGQYHLANEPERHGDDVLTNVNPAWYFRRPGGGPLYDVVVYYMTRLTGILGPAKRVTAFSGIVLPKREYRGEKIPVDIDDNTLMLLDFGGACYAFVHGACGGALSPGFVIFGTRGVLKHEADGPVLNGKPIGYPGREILQELRASGPKVNENAIMPHVTGAHRQIKEMHVFADIMELIDWIRDDKPSIVAFDHARHVIDIFESAYRSAATGLAQDLRTTFKPLEE